MLSPFHPSLIQFNSSSTEFPFQWDWDWFELSFCFSELRGDSVNFEMNMPPKPNQVAVRDLVEEAKKRIVILVICVVGLSYLMSCELHFPFNSFHSVIVHACVLFYLLQFRAFCVCFCLFSFSSFFFPDVLSISAQGFEGIIVVTTLLAVWKEW